MAQSYYAQMHLFPPNPYPQPPPPPIAHKVWILDCRSCGTFLTNRAMKAVLLLRPNVSLFSSDALPVNCSAYSANPDALRFRPPCRPSSSAPPRTCECLTQTLCCHGCGATIGYMIVIPCARCTSSISANNRATNGHRFVFHSTEVVGTERHYVQDEPGVIPYEPINTYIVPPERQSHFAARDYSRASPSLTSSPAASPEPDVDRIPTPTLEPANPLAFPPYLLPSSSAHDSRSSSSSSSPPRSLTPSDFYSGSYSHSYTQSNSYPYLYTTTTTTSRPTTPSLNPASDFDSSSPHIVVNPASIPGQITATSGVLSEQKDCPTSRALKPGDLLFWHHLVRSGEIPGAEDDKRARSRCEAEKTSYDDDDDDDGPLSDDDSLMNSRSGSSSSQKGVTTGRRGVVIGKVMFGR